MAHPAVVAYLRANKDRFSQAVLRRQLSQQGYPATVIEAGVAEVYGAAGTSIALHPTAKQPSVFDWRSRTVYRSSGQRAGHFFAGLILGGGLSSGFYVFSALASTDVLVIGAVTLLVVRVALFALFFWRRPWLGWGLVAASVLWQRGELLFLLSLIFSDYYGSYRYYRW